MTKKTKTKATKSKNKAPVKLKSKPVDTRKSNPAALKFPTDKWGCCRAFKQELLLCISNCAGHPDKMNLLRGTIKELMEHLSARDAAETEIKNIKILALKIKAKNEAAS